MPKSKKTVRNPKRSNSFTLVELLVVMAIIAILASLILAAGNGVMKKAMRSRTQAEIVAMSTAAESYKADNGIYPQGDGLLLTNSAANPYNASTLDGTQTEYQTNSTLLFEALSSQAYYGGPVTTTAPCTGKSYLTSLKVNQLGNPAGPYSYIKDPWNMSYGYSTGTPAGAATTNYPYNGSGFFDLWSTGGVTIAKFNANNSLTNTWISNWTQ